MGLVDLAIAAARAVASGEVQFDATRRVLRLSKALVGRLATQSIPANAGIKAEEVTLGADHVRIRLVLDNGITVSTRLEPEELRYGRGLLEFEAALPDGLEVGHDEAWKGAVVGFVDRVFGVAEAKTNAVPGLKLEKNRLKYERPMETPPALLAVLGLGAQPTRVPVRVRQEWLELDCRELGAAVRLDWEAARRLFTRG